MVPSEDFSKAFPLTVAEGELSLRVERLLAEGCRSLSTTGELSTAILVFPEPSKGKRAISIGGPNPEIERPLLHDKLLRASVLDRARKTIARFGASSVMMLDWVDVRLSGDEDAATTKAVLVVARDAKSYLEGLQPARQVDGKYFFDEPIVRVAKDDWFSQFKFSAPRGKTSTDERGEAQDEGQDEEIVIVRPHLAVGVHSWLLREHPSPECEIYIPIRQGASAPCRYST